MTIVARHLIIKGRVQGVFYRGWTIRTAQLLGLVGWVRNRHDGDVEAVVQGDPADVDRLIQLARQGPPAARVDAVVERPAEIAGFTGFEQRATV